MTTFWETTLCPAFKFIQNKKDLHDIKANCFEMCSSSLFSLIIPHLYEVEIHIDYNVLHRINLV